MQSQSKSTFTRDDLINLACVLEEYIYFAKRKKKLVLEQYAKELLIKTKGMI